MTTTDRTELAKLRDAFESWVASSNYPGISDIALRKLPDGNYKNQLTFAAFEGWKGAINNIATSVLETTEADVRAVEYAILNNVFNDDRTGSKLVGGIPSAARAAIAAMNSSATDIAALKAENERLRTREKEAARLIKAAFGEYACAAKAVLPESERERFETNFAEDARAFLRSAAEAAKEA